MAKAPAGTSADELRALIRAAGLKVTTPRLAVLAQLGTAGAPLSYGEVAELLHGRGWDRTTIYRNLMVLAKGGLLSRTDIGDHVWRFELSGAASPHNADGHPHFICNRCGGVRCLPEGSVQVNRQDGAMPVPLTGAVEIQVRGTCERCA